jgi:NAD(P)-dependent dehydrogenase (short-subunit alcohol dehydrogenase family)
MTLKEKRVLIFGGTAGIGFATAKAARLLEAEVIVVGRNSREFPEVLRDLGAGARAEQLDATQPEQVAALFLRLGGLDHLVLSVSAGPAGAGPIRTLELETLRAGFEGKFWPFVIALRAAIPQIRPGGSITFVSAASAGAPLVGTAGFAAINGAINAMVPGLAVELAPVRVNAVAPGLVDTRFWSALPERERAATLKQYASATPLGRNASPGDVAQAILSIVTNSFVTGVVLCVDGGLTLSPPKAA